MFLNEKSIREQGNHLTETIFSYYQYYQIDHVLITNKFKNCIIDMKTIRETVCDSDHYLDKVKMLNC